MYYSSFNILKGEKLHKINQWEEHISKRVWWAFPPHPAHCLFALAGCLPSGVGFSWGRSGIFSSKRSARDWEFANSFWYDIANSSYCLCRSSLSSPLEWRIRLQKIKVTVKITFFLKIYLSYAELLPISPGKANLPSSGELWEP